MFTYMLNGIKLTAVILPSDLALSTNALHCKGQTLLYIIFVIVFINTRFMMQTTPNDVS